MSEELILVTGVSGYIASHVTKLLLEEGRRVRGTVRDLSDEGRVAPLRALVPHAKHPLQLVEADLTKDDGWDKAMEGCTFVLHMASPFPDMMAANVTEEDLVKPAKEGTLRVLEAARAGGKVQRVVLTSSFAAVHGETSVDAEKSYNEEDWTDADSPELDAYTKSKVLAEKAAWDFVKELPEGEQKMELAVINPVFVLGPPLMEWHKSSTSVAYMTQVVNRAYPALPRLMFPLCDVRDVAKAHVQALTLPEAANKRHIVSTDSFWMREVALSASREFRPQGYNIPTGQLPYFVVWVAGLFNKTFKNHLLPRLGKPLKVDNKRMVETLGIEPTALDSTVQDMIYAMIDLGIVRKAKKYKQAGSRAEVPPAVNGEIEDEKKDKGTEKNEEEQKQQQEDEKKELEPEDKEEKKDEEIKKDDHHQPSEGKKEEEEKKKNNEEQKEESEAEK